MTTICLSEDVIPMSEFRDNLAGFIKQTQETKRPMLITQNGHSAAVLMDSAVFDELQEKLNTLAVYEDILVSEGQSARGEMISSEDFEKELLSRQATRHTRQKSSGKHETEHMAVAV